MSNIDTTFYEEFFEQQGVPEDRARFYLCSLLQKGARSGCIYKNELIMKRIMKARNILGFNMYISKFIPCQKMPKVYEFSLHYFLYFFIFVNLQKPKAKGFVYNFTIAKK